MKPSPPYVEESDLELREQIAKIVGWCSKRAIGTPPMPLDEITTFCTDLILSLISARKGQGIEGGSSSAESGASLPAEADCSAAQSFDGWVLVPRELSHLSREHNRMAGAALNALRHNAVITYIDYAGVMEALNAAIAAAPPGPNCSAAQRIDGKGEP